MGFKSICFQEFGTDEIRHEYLLEANNTENILLLDCGAVHQVDAKFDWHFDKHPVLNSFYHRYIPIISRWCRKNCKIGQFCATFSNSIARIEHHTRLFGINARAKHYCYQVRFHKRGAMDLENLIALKWHELLFRGLTILELLKALVVEQVADLFVREEKRQQTLRPWVTITDRKMNAIKKTMTQPMLICVLECCLFCLTEKRWSHGQV